ncbi:Pycsar system effector family protein [Dyadobacter sandarakinus]|uniref:HD domain-containing protein n=1 Tax=Dyadobacter sandarakinus TaxID=2747268 RepID=A0ABX7ICR6_9BACT|nr:Pycsar system effector family protein [Dyadobacter sandarakinus]QRR03902.1 HD domain-containing protein [Dyadobacter sandarakinus]
MNYQHRLEKVKQFVRKHFDQQEQVSLSYHNLEHTRAVAINAATISEYYNLGERENFIVQAAAWFHDTGYVSGEPAGHEQRGAELAGSFLRSESMDDSLVEEVKGCILATVWPQSPRNLLQEIICDADVFHFGTKDFSDWNKLVRKEAEERKGYKIDKNDWRKGTIRLLESHQYHTAYCRENLGAQKARNIAKLKEKVEDSGDIPATPVPSVVPPQEPDRRKEKGERPEKGIETMFRISSNNHQRLSDMADNKAHIMITTTSIIISVLLSVLIRKLEDNTYLIIPTVLLLTICMITMVFSILSTRPSIPAGTFTREDIEGKRVNLLFFGNFYKMTYDEYSEGMQRMMNDREFLYGSLTKDVYSQGVVLGRKYRLLRVAYNVFMFGIVASVIAFIIASTFIEH